MEPKVLGKEDAKENEHEFFVGDAGGEENIRNADDTTVFFSSSTFLCQNNIFTTIFHFNNLAL